MQLDFLRNEEVVYQVFNGLCFFPTETPEQLLKLLKNPKHLATDQLISETCIIRNETKQLLEQLQLLNVTVFLYDPAVSTEAIRMIMISNNFGFQILTQDAVQRKVISSSCGSVPKSSNVALCYDYSLTGWQEAFSRFKFSSAVDAVLKLVAAEGEILLVPRNSKGELDKRLGMRQLGFLLAPLKVSVFQALLKVARENGFDQVGLVARDGYWLTEIGNVLAHEKVQLKYVFASRGIAAITRRTVNEQYDYQRWAKELKNYCNLASFRGDPYLFSLLMDECLQKFDRNYANYITNVTANHKTLFFDSTTVKYSAAKLIKNCTKNHLNPDFFYIGKLSDEVVKNGTEFPNSYFLTDGEIFKWFMVEQFFHAPHFPVLGVYEDGSVLFQEMSEQETEQNEYSQYLGEGYLQFVKEYKKLFDNGFVIDGQDIVQYYYNLFIMEPTRDYQHIMLLLKTHIENFQSIGEYQIAYV